MITDRKLLSSQVRLGVFGLLLCVAAGPGYAMTAPAFFDGMARCIYPYFAAGLKWDLQGDERQRVIHSFAKKLPESVSFGGMPMNKITLDALCDGYRDISIPEKISRSEFEGTANELGLGPVLKALKRAR